MEKTFFSRYEAVFNRVCTFLGDGWKIDRRTEDAYRINLVNPAFRHYSIFARIEKDRIHLTGGVRSRSARSSGGYSACTVSPMRDPWGIAQDIRRKILPDAEKQIAYFEADRAGAQKIQDDRRILINLVGQLVEVQNYGGYYDVLCHIKTPGGISGDVCEMYGKAYRLKLGDLSKDQLIKVIGFLSTLGR